MIVVLFWSVGATCMAQNGALPTVYSPYTTTTLANSLGQADFAGGDTGPLARDAAGNFYVTDTFYVANVAKHQILRVAPSGGVTPIPGSVLYPLMAPSGLAVDAVGNLYVLDSGRAQLLLHPASGGLGIAGRFQAPTAMTMDSAGNVYISDSIDQHTVAIRKIVGQTVSTLATVSFPGFAAGVTAMACDAHGSIYMARPYVVSGGLHVLSPSGSGWTFSTLADFGQGSLPGGLAVDSAGVIYETFTDNARVIRGVPTGAGYDWTAIAGALQYSTPTGGRDGTGTNASFCGDFGVGPSGIVAGAHGEVFLFDAECRKLRKAVPAPVVFADTNSFGIQNGRLQLSFNGATGATMVLEASTNLTDWTPVLTNTTAVGSYSEAVGAVGGRRFFRTISP